jgi:hypothetical protein
MLMLISCREIERGNLLPSAFSFIAALPPHLLYNTEHDIRHPASAYSTSLRLIGLQWLKFLDCSDKLEMEYFWEGKTTTEDLLKTEYSQLLHRLNEHQDACYSVLRSLCPPNLAKPNRVDALFLDRANLAGWKTFRDATRSYREDHIGLIVNHLKHRQGELSAISFRSMLDFRAGYFLRDIVKDGVIGPSRKLHPGGNSAFSYARDQLIHLWWLYRIGDLLTAAIATATFQLSNTIVVSKFQEAPGLPWNDLLTRLSQIKPEFFPDELVKQHPLAKLSVNPSVFSIEFPSRRRGIPMSNASFSISTELTVDSNYPTNKMPYFGKGL